MVKDWTYKIAFDRKDLPSLEKMARHIRETHDTNMLERFHNKCDNFLQGNNPDFDLDLDSKPISISKTEDLVTNVGLSQCIRIIQGSSSKRWSHIAVSNAGASMVPPLVTDINLDNAGVTRWIPMAGFGWMEAKGMKLFFGAIGSNDLNVLQISTIREMGVMNGTNSGPTDDLLNREVFYYNPITRSLSFTNTYNAVFMLSSVIEFCPVA